MSLTLVHGMNRFTKLIANVDKTYRDLEKFCKGKNGNFCAKEYMELSTAFLKNQLYKMKIDIERLEKQGTKAENSRIGNHLINEKNTYYAHRALLG